MEHSRHFFAGREFLHGGARYLGHVSRDETRPDSQVIEKKTCAVAGAVGRVTGSLTIGSVGGADGGVLRMVAQPAKTSRQSTEDSTPVFLEDPLMARRPATSGPPPSGPRRRSAAKWVTVGKLLSPIFCRRRYCHAGGDSIPLELGLPSFRLAARGREDGWTFV